MELLNVDTVDEAREKLVKAISGIEMEKDSVALFSACGRIVAENIFSNEEIPGFRRSTVDGYAVISKDTAGSSESIPVFLRITGEVQMGETAQMEIHSGECVYVPTGGMIPKGADAVVMIEYCELFDQNQTAVYDSVAYGKNIVMAGEDIGMGDLVIKRGTRLRPQEVGVLSSLGITEVNVFRPWNITIISTGDEIVMPGEIPTPGKIRDINSYSICAQAQELGLNVLHTMVIRDDEEKLKKAVSEAMKAGGIVVISGGSSQGKKDVTNKIIDELADMGAFTHGLAIKPGKPTILGYDTRDKVILAGLPGHPAAAMIIFEMIIAWLWRKVTDQPEEKSVFARITSNFAGAPGKVTCQLVKLIKDKDCYFAEPLFGKSGLISSLAQADGYILIAQNKEGLKKDELVEVFYI